MPFDANRDLVIISLGSNLGQPRQNIQAAIARLQTLSEEPLLCSSFLETAPVDCPPGSPNFINAVVRLIPRPAETPSSLLVKLQAIEKSLGRAPKIILNESRVIDLDLIAFGQQIISSPDLTLPHPRAHLRRFVLEPLREIAPDYIFPNQFKTVAELWHTLLSAE